MLHPHEAKLRNLLWLSRIWIWKYVCFKFIVTNLSLGLIWSIMCVTYWTSIYSEYGSGNINPKSDTTTILIGNCKCWTLIRDGEFSVLHLCPKETAFLVLKKRASWHSQGWGAHRWSTVNTCKIELQPFSMVLKTHYQDNQSWRSQKKGSCL